MPIPSEQLIELHKYRKLARGGYYFYYARLEKSIHLNNIIRAISDLFTSTSILGLAIWNLAFPEKQVALLMAIFAAIAAVVGWFRFSLMNLPEEIEKCSRLLNTYRIIDNEFNVLDFKIRGKKNMTLEEYLENYGVTRLKFVDADPNLEVKLDEKIKEKVDKELPEEKWRISYITTKEMIAKLEEK